jgi:hypothetical protein
MARALAAWSPRCESNPDALPDWCDVFTVAACATL